MGNDTEGRFSAMYETHYGRVHAYADRRVGPDAAEEVTAETFAVAWRRFADVPEPPLPWLYGVARNMISRQRVAGARRQVVQDGLARERVELVHGPEESADPALWQAWHRLGDGDREVLALIAWEELPVAEAAQALGCSPPVFSVRLHRARKRLERLLAAPAGTAHAVSTVSEAS